MTIQAVYRLPFASLALAAACVFVTSGCRRQGTTVLGKAPLAMPSPIREILVAGAAPQVTIRGVMIEKCPVAGCWLRLRDQTGTIKVDTKSAGFSVVGVPLKSPMTVTGTVIHDGDDVTLAATGLSY